MRRSSRSCRRLSQFPFHIYPRPLKKQESPWFQLTILLNLTGTTGFLILIRLLAAWRHTQDAGHTDRSWESPKTESDMANIERTNPNV